MAQEAALVLVWEVDAVIANQASEASTENQDADHASEVQAQVAAASDASVDWDAFEVAYFWDWFLFLVE